MPNIKELMTHIKNAVRKAPKLGQLKSSDLIRALYLSGLMLYAVQKASPSVANDLLREILAIIRFELSFYVNLLSIFLVPFDQYFWIPQVLIVKQKIFQSSQTCFTLRNPTFPNNSTKTH